MQKDVVFSIIVPIFNAEKTICNCCDSIMNQSFQCSEYEVILVDDGSTDSSLAICQKYQISNKNVKVLHQSNKGVSAARNLGMEYAKGRWIIFVDADDQIMHNLLQQLNIYCTDELDILFFAYDEIKQIVHKESADKVRYNVLYLSKETVIKEALTYRQDINLHARFNTSWGKAIRRDVINLNSIKFDSNIKIAEDFIFSLELYAKTKNYAYIDYIGYYYFKNTKSTIRKYQDWLIQNNVIVHKRFEQIRPEIDNYDWFENAYYYSVNKGLINIISIQIMNPLNPKGKKEKTNQLRQLIVNEPYNISLEHFSILHRTYSVKHKVVLFLTKYRMFTSLYVIFMLKQLIKSIFTGGTCE